MQVRKRLGLALLFLVVVLGACRRTEDAAAPTADAQTFVPHEDEEHGLSLEYPEGWVTHRAMSGLTVASSQKVVDSNALSEIGDEAFVNIIPGELAVFGMQTGQTFNSGEPQPVLQMYKGLLENEGQSYSVREQAEVTTVEGRRVATMVVESEVEGETLVTILGVVLDGDYMALVSAGALELQFDSMRPTLKHVINSIAIAAPGNKDS